MAIFTSFKKYFEVTGISFSPNIITVGEETNYSITIKNVSGKKITRMKSEMRLYYRATDGDVHESNKATVYGGTIDYGYNSISWANNATKTFTGKFTFTPLNSYPPNIDTRLLPLYKGSDIGYTESYGGNERLGLFLNIMVPPEVSAVFPDGGNSDWFFDLRGVNSEYLYVIDARYTPAITVFDAERCTNGILDDEGENLLASIALRKSTDAKISNMSLYLYYRDKAKPDADPTRVTLSNLIASASASVIDTVIAEKFDKNADWNLVLWFGDEYESTTSAIEVSRSFANVHLSGATTGGICFGSFSKATENNPLFQNYYPSVFYEVAQFDGGIHGVTNYDLGEVETGGRWIDGRKIYRRVVQVNVAATDALTEIADVPGVAVMVNMYGYVTRASGTQRFPLTFWFSDSNYHSFMLNGDKLGVKTSAAISGYAVIEYTKTEEASS